MFDFHSDRLLSLITKYYLSFICAEIILTTHFLIGVLPRFRCQNILFVKQYAILKKYKISN
jgi:hypothetical protein